jgi:hypothetical protein
MPRGSGMAPTRRRNRGPKGDTPATLAARLPDELRSFGAWCYADDGASGLRDYLDALSRWLFWQGAPYETSDVTAVMNAAGLCAADWYRSRLSGQPNAL